jgi:hypothetical protein
MERAAEQIGPDVLVRYNQRQLAERLDAAIAPLRDALLTELRKIDADERFHYPCATVAVNAPLALVQLAMEARVSQAQWVLATIGYDGPEMTIRGGPEGKS